MDILKGKKVLCFVALPHHTRFLVPIMEALKDRGMEVVYFTAAAEAAFEITLNEAGLSYRHALDYANAEVKERAVKSFRLLRPVWQEKVLASRVLQAVPLPIQDKIIHSAVENLYCFERMIEVEKPDILFALHEINSWGKLLGYLSHVHRIPYITFQEGLCYAATPLYRFHTDYSTACLTWGEADRQVLLAAGCSADKIATLGNMDIWSAREKATRDEEIAAARKALGIAPQKKVVLFLMSHANYRPFEPTLFLKWLDAHRDVVVIFKWHPVTGKETIEKALGKLKGMPSILSLHNNFDTYALLAISDVCVTVGNSTTGLEALIFGKPLVEISLPDQCYSFADQEVAERAQGLEDIGDKVGEILTHGLSPERQKKVADYLAHHFAFFDGKSVERVADMVAEMLAAKEGGGERQRIEPEREKDGRSLSDSSVFPCSVILPVDDAPLENVISTLKGIAANVPPALFEILVVNAATEKESRELLSSLKGDVRIIAGEPEWSFSDCCNRAAAEARGRYLVFLKPGLIPCPGWLEGLLKTVEEEKESGIVGGRVVSENGLLWHIGVAFDVNNGPFSIYRMLPPEFTGAQRQREFRAVELPFLVSRELFCRLGGFSTEFVNRFEDVDLCLRVRKAGLRVLYTPEATILRIAGGWEPSPNLDQTNRIRFYAKWTGSLWQDDDRYLTEDGMDHDALSLLYRQVAAGVAAGAQGAVAQESTAVESMIGSR